MLERNTVDQVIELDLPQVMDAKERLFQRLLKPLTHRISTIYRALKRSYMVFFKKTVIRMIMSGGTLFLCLKGQ